MLNFKFAMLRVIICVTLIGSTLNTSAQRDTLWIGLDAPLPATKLFFQEEAPIEISLKYNHKDFRRSRIKKNYLNALLYVKNNSNQVLCKQVRIKARGIFRNQHCSSPPFWLNTQQTKKNSLSPKVNEKFKVVTHCNKNPIYEKYLLKEYLLYKIYNILTEYSLRVQLISINYLDENRNKKPQKRFGIIIEPIENLADRMLSVQVKSNNLGLHYTHSKTTDLLCMFAYMVGNTDWSISGRHNIKLLKPTDHNQPDIYPIPYDFDFTGFINTHYATPADGTGLESVRERVYVGPCRDLKEYTQAANIILSKMGEIEKLINNFGYLDKKSKDDLLDYLENFYSLIQRPNYIQYHIDIDCISIEGDPE